MVAGSRGGILCAGGSRGCSGNGTEDVHQLDGLALHLEYDVVDACGKPVVAEVGYDADEQTAYGGYHGGVDTAGEECDVDVAAGRGHVVEGLDHSDYGPEESDHRGSTCHCGEHRQSFFEFCNLDVGHVLDCCLDVGQGIALALEAFLDETCHGGGCLTAKADGRGCLAGADKLADIVHEVGNGLGGLADGPPAAANDIDGDNGQDQKYDHQPSSGDGHLDEGHLFGGGCGLLDQEVCGVGLE